MKKPLQPKISIDHIHKHLLDISETLYSIKTNQEDALDKIGILLTHILTNQKNMGNTLDEVLTDVEAESTQIDGLTKLTSGLKQQLADALSGANLPPAVQAKVDAVFAGVEANKQKVIDAINANTPAAEEPTA